MTEHTQGKLLALLGRIAVALEGRAQPTVQGSPEGVIPPIAGVDFADEVDSLINTIQDHIDDPETLKVEVVGPLLFNSRKATRDRDAWKANAIANANAIASFNQQRMESELAEALSQRNAAWLELESCGKSLQTEVDAAVVAERFAREAETRLIRYQLDREALDGVIAARDEQIAQLERTREQRCGGCEDAGGCVDPDGCDDFQPRPPTAAAEPDPEPAAVEAGPRLGDGHLLTPKAGWWLPECDKTHNGDAGYWFFAHDYSAILHRVNNWDALRATLATEREQHAKTRAERVQ
jgi:hypothetical protein